MKTRYGIWRFTKTSLQTWILTGACLASAGCAFLGFSEEDSRKAKYDQFRRIYSKTPEEIFLGMPMNSVRNTWGMPLDVETSGERSQGNQRWVYTDASATGVSLGKKRVVYFEQGRVVGWETLEP